MNAFYNQNLSHIHDAYFSDLAKAACKLVLDLVDVQNLYNTMLVDLGCGSGVLASELSEKGMKVLGVDISEAMIRIASEKATKAQFVCSSIYTFEIPSCDVITCIGEPLNYITDSEISYESLERLFLKAFNSLSSNGYFIFDILTNQFPKSPSVKLYETAESIMVVSVSVNEATNVLERKIILFSKAGVGYTKEVEVHRQFLFDRELVMTLLRKVGFEVDEINHYDHISFRPGHVGFICRK